MQDFLLQFYNWSISSTENKMYGSLAVLLSILFIIALAYDTGKWIWNNIKFLFKKRG